MFSVFFIKATFKKSRRLGKVSRKKVAVLMDFVHMRGRRALPKFFVTFS